MSWGSWVARGRACARSTLSQAVALTVPFARIEAALRDRYAVQRQLGEGAMATVFLAHDLKHERLVAVKVLRPELAEFLGAERFHHEITLTANLQHPHILPLHDSGNADGLLYYVMPYVEGESLRDRMAREGQLPLEDALRITREVADALGYAHAKGVLHRDVKPDNIMLSRGHALLADFGIAAAVEGVGGERLTDTGITVGTPHYMSPEQSLSTRALDPRSDLYSLGCVLYEMLAGEPPHTGPSAQAIIARRLTEEPRALHTVRTSVSAELEAVAAKALALSPADRYGSAEALVAALDRSVSGAAIPAATQGAAPVGKRRYRQLAWSAGAAALAVTALLVWRPWLGPGGMPAPPRIAVVPFSFVGAADDEFFADGVTELITTRLASMPGLRMVSRASAAQFKDSERAASEIGRTLRVDYLLTGIVRASVEGSGERRLRVTPVLVRVGDEVEVWSQPYNAALGAGLFGVQEQIARQVASAMHVVFPRTGSRAGLQRQNVDPRVLESYMLGRFHWRKRSQQGLLAAQGHFREAIARDSTFAPAWSGLADAIALYRFYWNRESNAEGYGEAAAMARRAIALDDDLAEAYASLGYALTYEYSWDEAEAALKRAIALDPEDASFHNWYGNLLFLTGRADQAIAELNESLQLDPLFRGSHVLMGYSLSTNNRWDEAAQHFRRAIEIDPEQPEGYWQLGWHHALRGESDSTLALWRRHDELAGIPPEPESVLRAVANSLRKGAPHKDVLIAAGVGYRRGDDALLAWVYTSAGMTDSALAAIGRGADQKNLRILWGLSWYERQIGPHPRFAEIRRKYGIKD